MSDNTNNIRNIDKTNDTLLQIKKLYLKSGYMDKHGTDVWVSAILCVVFAFLICYYYYVNVLQVVRTNWQEHKCNPLLIPFAGIINNPSDKSSFEFTASNFSGCVNSMLKDIVEVAVHPFIFMVNILHEATENIAISVQNMRKLSYNTRMEFINTIQKIYDTLMNVVAYFINFTIKIKDTVDKVKGNMAAVLYSIFGSYMALQSLFGGIVDLLNKFMVYGGYIIQMLIFLAACLFAGLLTFPLGVFPLLGALSFFSVWVILLIPVLIYKYLILHYLSITPPPNPKNPNWSPVCFSGETIIDVIHKNNTRECVPTLLKNVKIGNILKNGEKVTSVIKGTSNGQTIYELDGILVTSEHRVYEPSLKWIKVKNHPKSNIIKTFNEPFVYCLGTDKKVFTIKDTLFSDWDDIDESVLYKLSENCINEGKHYLPNNFKLSDIHTHLDSGFLGNMQITMNNGSVLPISSIKVNDELLNGVKVIAIVKIDAHDMTMYTHKITDTTTITGSQNIHINDSNLGKINCMNLKSKCIEPGKHNEKYLYHLITNKKGFIINGIWVNDYNSGIDLYL